MSLLKTTAKGIAWTTISTCVRSIVQLFQVAILTRYLEQSDFGLVAIATLFLGFAQIFMDLGLSAGIMHKQDITPSQYSSLFWLNIISGTVLTIILCSFSPLIAYIYNDKELVPILCWLSSTIMFTSLGSQHRIVQQKKLRFKYISIIEIIISLFALSISSVLAMNHYGVYSLVYANVAQSFFCSLMFLSVGLYMDKNISFHINLNEVRLFFKIGSFSLGTQLLDYLSRELDIVIIAATFNPHCSKVKPIC
ncbi:MAG: oligosaccharide flippase family protein [Intestinibacter sp.]|uniref:oligosaccharide flippase family protein n=1 Tax=Intestinibacter sp. TaxID=1965304 RepID=UPI003F18D521